MKSEVERNQKLIRVGDKLFYTDDSNSESWVITELFKGGFEAKNVLGDIDIFFFNYLQLGWEISESSKKENTGLHHFRYV